MNVTASQIRHREIANALLVNVCPRTDRLTGRTDRYAICCRSTISNALDGVTWKVIMICLHSPSHTVPHLCL